MTSHEELAIEVFELATSTARSEAVQYAAQAIYHNNGKSGIREYVLLARVTDRYSILVKQTDLYLSWSGWTGTMARLKPQKIESGALFAEKFADDLLESVRAYLMSDLLESSMAEQARVANSHETGSSRLENCARCGCAMPDDDGMKIARALGATVVICKNCRGYR